VLCRDRDLCEKHMHVVAMCRSCMHPSHVYPCAAQILTGSGTTALPQLKHVVHHQLHGTLAQAISAHILVFHSDAYFCLHIITCHIYFASGCVRRPPPQSLSWVHPFILSPFLSLSFTYLWYMTVYAGHLHSRWPHLQQLALNRA
jgi:hypothetical protein